MRVLCLTPWFPDRPGEREGNYIFDSVTALKGAGVDVKVMVARPWKPWRGSRFNSGRFDRGFDIKLHHYPSLPRNMLRRAGNRIHFLTILPRVLAFARKHEVELIHAHTEGMAEVAAAAADKLGIGALVTIHGINTSPRYMGTRAQRNYFRNALNRCDRVVLVGEPLRPFFADICGRDDHFRVVHNGFRLTGALPGGRRIGTETVTRLISVSNLHEGKGIDLTIRALAHLEAQGVTRWHYTIVGDGYLMPELERLVQELGLGKKITFIGAVEHAQVAGYLGQADIFVLPSYREAFGIAYLEAMACGLLAIGVEGQGAAEFLRHGENGLLVPAKNIGALAEAISHPLAHPEEARRLAAAGQQTAQHDFNWGRHGESLAALYREVIASKRGMDAVIDGVY